MGSNPSKRIQSADVPKRQRANTPQRSLSLANTTSTKVRNFQQENDLKNDRTSSNAAEDPQSLSELQNELIATKRLMTEIECHNLELQDEIQTLEQQLEFAQQENNKHPRSDTYGETVQVKDQQIEKLQKEIETLQTDMSELRLKCKKKIRIIKRKSALAKNEGAMEIVELKEEIAKLEEENQSLRKKFSEESKSGKANDCSATETCEEDKDTGKMKIILDLSAQVSEQDNLLTELGNKLNEHEKYIGLLERQLKEANTHTHTEKRQDHSESVEGASQTAAEGSTIRNRMRFGALSGGASFSEEPEDINWYTNQTFEQLSKGKQESALSNGDYVRVTKNTDQGLKDKDDCDEEGKSELSAIADEIKKLQRGKKKKSKADSKTKHHRIDLDQELSSGKTKHRSSESEQGPSHSGGFFVTQTSDNSDDSDFGSASERMSEVNSPQEDVHLSRHVDKSSVRQISGLGKKSKRKQKSNHLLGESDMVRHPGVRSINGKDSELSEASLLIDSIDEDMRQLTAGTRQRVAVVST